jgi:TolC family type I secretion outer membrane protein
MNETKGFIPKFAAMSVMALLVAGCAVDQKKEVATYRKIIDNNQPAQVQIDPGQVITLTDALRLANQNEEQLSIQGETYLQSLIDKDEAFSAFLPTVSVTPSYTLNTVNNNTFGSTDHNVDVPVNGQMNLFNGFRDYHSLKAADATIEQKKQLILDLQQTVLLDVAQTYYQVLTSEQSVEVLTNSIAVQKARVENIQAQAAVGTARPLDVAQAQAELSSTQVSLNQSKADVRNGRSTLAFLVDAPIEENPLRDDFSAPAATPVLAEWTATAEAGRQDLLAANAAVKAARENVEVAFGQYYPSVAVNLNYNLYDEILGGGGAWTGLLSVNAPIFTGGLIEANVRSAWSAFRTAALTQAQLRRTIDEGVEQAYINLELARQQLKELQVEVEAARQALYLADQLYKTGNGTLLDVLVAQDTLLTTQLELTTEQFQQKTAYFNLLRTVGTLKLTMGQAGTPATQAEQRLRQLATMPSTYP